MLILELLYCHRFTVEACQWPDGPLLFYFKQILLF